ncbi:hypothetical protein [Teredinibacter sp. KSP-S5-2]|uniref:hypothetical protein n=1 Tax=Teredinibacter sp. KSP-S5-2 TaxID=3034506 RepID=UPI0029349E61|nr:hypothetical protein [Teredinibacter sp. KSP-S5-2]WNO08923.1 hypothetical protein P5V12_18410 [Teredinibacter sp. KSP-S5-2]
MTLPINRIFALIPFILIVSCGNDDAPKGDLNDTYAYQANSPYIDSLAPCVRHYNFPSCTLHKLPIIGLDHESPSIENVMDHVVVSHDWMGERFEQVLNQLPTEVLYLFKGVTAVVIDNDIRPAFYSHGTGAIYLDPALLWLTVQEKRTINPKEDYRAGFSDPLSFRSVWRYVKGNTVVSARGSLSDMSERTLEDIIPTFAALLFHELAHANDFIAPGSYQQINRNLTVSQTIDLLHSSSPSIQLRDSAPLSSSLLYGLAGVMFHGHAPSDAERAISADEVGQEFEMDIASDDYAYSSLYEDTAMLFEEAMMKYFFDIDRDIAFTTPPGANNNCQDYVVKWGIRNRIGDEEVRIRAQLVVEQLMLGVDFGTFFTDLVTPTPLNNDVSWCQSVTIQANSVQQKVQSDGALEQMPLINPHLRPYL